MYFIGCNQIDMRPLVSKPLKIKALRKIVFKKSLGLDLGQSFWPWKLAENKAPENLTQTKGKGTGQGCASYGNQSLSFPLASPARPVSLPWACLGLGLSLLPSGDMRGFKASLCFALGLWLPGVSSLHHMALRIALICRHKKAPLFRAGLGVSFVGLV
jgi:hypothetical protein